MPATRKDSPQSPPLYIQLEPSVLRLRSALRKIACAEAQAVEADEAGGVALIVPGLHALHGRDVHIVERVFRLPAASDDVALVELEANSAGDVLLGLVD